MNDEDHEAAVGRLLRSTSARLADNSELDYATLPPIRESFYCTLFLGKLGIDFKPLQLTQ